MTPPRAFDFSKDVAIVTGAGSRMQGELVTHGLDILITDEWLS